MIVDTGASTDILDENTFEQANHLKTIELATASNNTSICLRIRITAVRKGKYVTRNASHFKLQSQRLNPPKRKRARLH